MVILGDSEDFEIRNIKPPPTMVHISLERLLDSNKLPSSVATHNLI
jgi:hypothetical protein